MNKERLLEIADVIENSPQHFNIATPISNKNYYGSCELSIEKNGKTVLKGNCGTTACIAGFGYVYNLGKLSIKNSNVSWDIIKEQAMEYFGLNYEQATELFEISIAKSLGIITEDDYYEENGDIELEEDIWFFDNDPVLYAHAAACRIRQFVEDN